MSDDLREAPGSWASGLYSSRRGCRVCCEVTFFGDEPPSLWTRILMRLQGWTWVPNPSWKRGIIRARDAVEHDGVGIPVWPDEGGR